MRQELEPNQQPPQAVTGVSTHPFLVGLAPAQADRLTELATDRIFASGDFLCREGYPAEVFYLLREGRVSLEVHVPNRSGLRIATLHGGDVLGWSWLVAPHRWRLDARALDPVRTIEINGARLRRLCQQDHELGFEILSRFAGLIGQRLHVTRLQLLEHLRRAKEGMHSADA